MAKKIATTVDMLGNKITGLAPATNASDAVRFDQLGSIALQEAEVLLPEIVVKYVSTANVASLVGPQTVDGMATVAGDYVLLKKQTTASQNGVWKVGAASVAWSRATGYDSDAEIRQREVMCAGDGSVNKVGYCFICTNTGTVVPGTTALTYAQVPNGIGTGALNACPGNDARLSDTRQTKIDQTTLTVASGVASGSWSLTNGSEMILNLGVADAGSPFVLTLLAQTAGSVNYLTVIGHATAPMLVRFVLSGVIFVTETALGVSGAQTNVCTLGPLATSILELKWISSTKCFVRNVCNDAGANNGVFLGKTYANFDAIKNAGVYEYDDVAVSTGGYPDPSGIHRGILEVFRGPNAKVIQFWRPRHINRPSSKRIFDGTTWAAWVYEGEVHMKLNPGTDLNGLIYPGHFTTAGTYLNMPFASDMWGMLEIVNAGEGFCIQLFYAVGWNGIRMRNTQDGGATWGGWAAVYG